MLVLITGGARSGKSSFAEQYAARLGQQGIYIATAQAYDAEMKERIALHRRQREDGKFRWRTVEEPFALAPILQRWNAGKPAGSSLDADNSLGTTVDFDANEAELETEDAVVQELGTAMKNSVVLVDCLTLWLSNWLLRYEKEPDVEERLSRKLDELLAACKQFTALGHHLLLVTNEVGYGLVPEYKLGRQFRDASGMMNQRLAREAEQVFLVTSGIPVELKSRRFRWDGHGNGIGD
jgi:adenosylcobinamide kinase/adenosylcobinamide-phosphate guanylyltransferase